MASFRRASKRGGNLLLSVESLIFFPPLSCLPPATIIDFILNYFSVSGYVLVSVGYGWNREGIRSPGGGITNDCEASNVSWDPP